MGASHNNIFVEKGDIFWEGRIYSGRVAHMNSFKRGYILGGRGIFVEGHTLLLKGGGYILGERDRFWQRRKIIYLLGKVVYSGREG